MQLDIQSNPIFELRSRPELTVNCQDKTNKKYNSESLQSRYDIMMKNHSSNPIWLPASKHPHISPNGFELWIETHANESGPNIPKRNNVQRKKSVLSMVSFLLEEESSDEDDEDEAITPLTSLKEDFPTLPELKQREYPVNMPEHKIRLRRQSAHIRSISQQNSNSPIKIPEIETKSNKKSSWFTNLFNKSKKSKESKKNSFSTLFTNKNNNSSLVLLNSTYPFEPKKTLKKKKERLPSISPSNIIPQPLITRYPLHTERAVYELSHVKLNNPKRPLRQQVVISNMMYWYLSITEQSEYNQQQQQQQSHSFDNAYQATCQTFEPPALGGEQRPTSPPLNNVTTKSNKKKYKPVPNTEYVAKIK